MLTILRTTVFGQVLVHAFALAEDAIFTDCVCAARRQLGCMRFCYVSAGCRTPRRFRCQPDVVEAKIETSLRNAVLTEALKLSDQALAAAGGAREPRVA